MNRALISIGVFLFALSTAAPVHAGSLQRDDYYRHPGEEKQLADIWTSIITTQDGWAVYLSYVITNMGVFAGQSGVGVSVTDPAGHVTRIEREYRPEDFSEDRAKGFIQVKDHRVDFRHPDYHMTIRDAELSLDLHLNAWMKGYKFGDGTVWVDTAKTEYLKYFFLVPRGTATGTLTLGGKKIPLQGDGYFEHQVANRIAPTWSRRWYVLDIFAPEYTVHFMEGYPLDEFRHLNGKLGFFALTDRKGVVLASHRPQLKFRNVVKGERDCSWPTEFHLEAADKRGKAAITYRLVKLHDAYSVLDQLSWPVRKLVELFIGEPVFFRFQNTYDLELTIDGNTQKISGKALHQVVSLHPDSK